MSVLRLAHIGAWKGRGNYGDLAIKHGVQRCVEGLARRAGVGLVWEPVDIQSAEFDEQYIRLLASRNDGVILGGGGLLWERPGTAGPSGWQWKIENHLLADWELPLVVWGIGWTGFPHHDRTGTTVAMAESMRLLRDRADIFSVRNALTARRLSEYRVTPDYVVPCPAALHPVAYERDPDAQPIIGVVWGSDNPSMRWGTIERGEAYARTFAARLATAAAWADARVRFMPHIRNLDEDIVGVLRAALGDRLEEIPRYTHPPTAAGLHMLRLHHAECSIVFSMRKHGVILAAAQGVYPVGLGDVAEVAATAGQYGGTAVTSDGIEAGAFERAFERAGTAPVPWPHLRTNETKWENRMLKWIKALA